MTAQVTARAVRGRFVRHAPHDSDPLHRPEPPPDGRWQRGELVGGLYLADEPATAWAEWYRHLAERGLPPEHAIPHDLHVWAVDVELADLSTGARLAAIGLPSPRPGRRTWASYQRVGEQLWRDGWAGVCAPSAARPEHMVICLFVGPWPPAGANPLPGATISVTAAPPPPRGMRT